MTYVRDTGNPQSGYERSYTRGVFARFVAAIGALAGDVFQWNWQLLRRIAWDRSAQLTTAAPYNVPADNDTYPFIGVNYQLRQYEAYLQGSGPVTFDAPAGGVIDMPPPPMTDLGGRGAVYIVRVTMREQTREEGSFFVGLIGDARADTDPTAGAIVAVVQTGDMVVEGLDVPAGWSDPKDAYATPVQCCARDVWLRFYILEGETNQFLLNLAVSWDGVNFFAPAQTPPTIDFVPTGIAFGLDETSGIAANGPGRDVWGLGDIDMYQFPDGEIGPGHLPHAGARSTR